MPVSETILPVLIGADMNCYTLARAFHEAYGVRSYAFGRWAMEMCIRDRGCPLPE